MDIIGLGKHKMHMKKKTNISDDYDCDRFDDYTFIFIVKQWIFQVCINYFKWRSKQNGSLSKEEQYDGRAIHHCNSECCHLVDQDTLLVNTTVHAFDICFIHNQV
ncbi:hypothetical protein BCV71DRAFT_236860 [Rhizopus microsporus]|uniref:Uncharacterized protein n=1 Tax=Rhizopus microsporus TaxID=58291 RepID=A0A1X0RW43_RHIZD|nr:hypothetical protein BCV71DRAFT_236860 [Rhizopus microsporus]